MLGFVVDEGDLHLEPVPRALTTPIVVDGWQNVPSDAERFPFGQEILDSGFTRNGDSGR
jgi:hypothetical protein